MNLKQIDPATLRPPNRIWAPRLLLAGFVVGLLLLQIVPWSQGFDNPPVLVEPDWDSQRTRQLAKRACWDCHSNETEWPWYTRVAPFSMVIRKDVERGREALNFQVWDAGDAYQIEDMTETITKREMPLSYYIILHPEADLTSAERGELINGLIATVRQDVLDAEDLGPAPPGSQEESRD